MVYQMTGCEYSGLIELITNTAVLFGQKIDAGNWLVLIIEMIRFKKISIEDRVVEGFRWALLGVETAPGPMIFVSSAAAVCLLFSGAYYFRRMEKSFADLV